MREVRCYFQMDGPLPEAEGTGTYLGAKKGIPGLRPSHLSRCGSPRERMLHYTGFYGTSYGKTKGAARTTVQIVSARG